MFPKDRITPPEVEPLFKSFESSSSWFLQPLVIPQLRSFHILSFLSSGMPVSLWLMSLEFGGTCWSRTHIYLAQARPAEIFEKPKQDCPFFLL